MPACSASGPGWSCRVGRIPMAVARVEALARACGANPFRSMRGRTTRYVAAISHMPLIVSAALVEAVAGTGAQPRADWAWAEALAAGGWDSMTRLARGDATMGAGIAATNAEAIATRLRDVRATLDEWIAHARGRRRPGRAGPPRAVRGRPGAAPRRRRVSGGPDEQVLVVPRASIVPGDGWLGVRRDGLRGARRVAPRRVLPAPRRRRGGPDPQAGDPVPRAPRRRAWFLMRRTRAGGDARLHDLWSIGVGGHLNPGDGDVAGRPPARVGARRSSRSSSPRLSRSGCSTTTPRRSAPSTSGSCSSPTPRAGRSRSARPTSSRVVRDDQRGRRGRETRWRRGAGSCSTR